jgi:uncharacterized phage-associated protein
MYDVLTVADAVLKIAKARGQSLTPMQLMKLVYIAHGWSLGIRSFGLFHNRIEAWQYGPVMPDLYHATKQFGRNSIPLAKVGDAEDLPVDESDAAFLTDVFDKYGHLNGIQLSYLTHQSGTPWDKSYRKNVLGQAISDQLIMEHYRDLKSARSVA